MISINGLLKKIYFSRSQLSEKDMQISRVLSIFEGCSARTILTLSSGAFLVGYAKYLGASDRISGIIAAIPSLAGIIMAVSPMVFERLEFRKLLISVLCFIGRLSLGSMIFIPFISVSSKWRVLLLIGLFLFANLALLFTLPAAQSWIISLTREKIRGKYFGMREFYVLGFVSIVALVLGRVLDFYRYQGKEFIGFYILFAIVLILAVFNFIFMSSIKEQPLLKGNLQISKAKMLFLPIKNNRYIRVILLMILWNLGIQLSAPFSSVYMVSYLQLGYTYITVMALIASVTSVLIVRFWGKLADRKSWIFLMKILIIIQAVSCLVWFFTNKNTALVLIPLAHLLNGAAASGVNIAVFNIQFNFAPEMHKTIYIGVSSAIGGVAGFMGTLIGSAIIGAINQHRFYLYGLSFGSTQFLFILSCGILLSGIILMKCSFNKENCD